MPQHKVMPQHNARKAPRDYPGRLSRDEWFARSIAERCLLVARAEAVLLDLWRSCEKKPCRRARSCLGDETCALRPWQADLKNPNLGRPDFRFSFQLSDELRIKFAQLRHLAYLSAELAPESCPVPMGKPPRRRRARPPQR